MLRMTSLILPHCPSEPLGGDGTVVLIKLYLEKEGYTVFMGEATLKGGQLWADRIQDAVLGCQDDKTALHWASQKGRKEAVEVLLREGADVAATTRAGATALHYASKEGRKEAMEALLGGGADVAAKTWNTHSGVGTCHGQTALLHASQEGHQEVVEALLQRGADVAAKDKRGYTALHLASKEGRKNAVEVLLRVGADVTAKDSDGKTALHYASQKGHTEVVEALLRADVAAKDIADKTSPDMAKAMRRRPCGGCGASEVVALLKRGGLMAAGDWRVGLFLNNRRYDIGYDIGHQHR
ncbi:Ankyrin repeat domain-containing protein [Tetrabaena socialis]|uniref:Ankyrin repeat domain-containing protein n=1 Tax=Tetrabaena socialis TaxID=47790 RepID=A0A2J7ZKB5_9CHLO|nr:Ankyrin repeat domain-containing protein [Tetrabaena socialis]|eukprot:PNH00705.1 Ankyrin repeat domain-containing protein [Tetrabaena socialis]